MGGQVNGVTYGSVYALQAAGASVSFYRYDIATNAWSAALVVTNVPAALATDARLVCPEPSINAYQGGYHNAQALNTITASAQANAGATTISVTALPLALPIGARLNFGTRAAPVWAVLTAAAAAAATSITVAALIATVPSAAVAYFYGDMFLVGHNATVMYRYNIAANAWSTTSANSGNPAIPAVPGAVGAGCVLAWLPGSEGANALSRLIVVRGGATSNIYEYDLITNTWSTLTYYPSTETFTTGTCSAIEQNAAGKNANLLIQQNTSGRWFRLNRVTNRLDCVWTNNVILSGTALVGDRGFATQSSDGVTYVYYIPSTSAFFVRSGLYF
jgi:hypothetical protein